MYKKTILRLHALVIFGCITLGSTALLARNSRDDEYYDEDERSNKSAGRGALFGSATGAVIGGVAGGPVGAVVGATAGGGTGALIGHEKDKKREHRSRRRRDRDQDELDRLREENAALKQGK